MESRIHVSPKSARLSPFVLNITFTLHYTCDYPRLYVCGCRTVCASNVRNSSELYVPVPLCKKTIITCSFKRLRCASLLRNEVTQASLKPTVYRQKTTLMQQKIKKIQKTSPTVEFFEKKSENTVTFFTKATAM